MLPRALEGDAENLFVTLSARAIRPDLFIVARARQDESVPKLANAGADRRYGIRVTLPATDTFRIVIGEDWERFHWYATEAERDKAFESMARRHGYYRKTDAPTQILEKIER